MEGRSICILTMSGNACSVAVKTAESWCGNEKQAKKEMMKQSYPYQVVTSDKHNLTIKIFQVTGNQGEIARYTNMVIETQKPDWIFFCENAPGNLDKINEGDLLLVKQVCQQNQEDVQCLDHASLDPIENFTREFEFETRPKNLKSWTWRKDTLIKGLYDDNSEHFLPLDKILENFAENVFEQDNDIYQRLKQELERSELVFFEDKTDVWYLTESGIKYAESHRSPSTTQPVCVIGNCAHLPYQTDVVPWESWKTFSPLAVNAQVFHFYRQAADQNCRHLAILAIESYRCDDINIKTAVTYALEFSVKF